MCLQSKTSRISQRSPPLMVLAAFKRLLYTAHIILIADLEYLMTKGNPSRHLISAVILFLAFAPIVMAQAPSQRNSTDVEGDFARATRLHESGDLEGAIRGYEQILAAHPERADVRSNLGAAYSRLGRYED